MWLKLILIGVTLLFILILVVKRFAYFRPTYEFMAPIDTYQDIYEGNLHAWYKSGTSGKVILFCHGNAGNLSYRQNKLIEFTKMGHGVLIFDYSGFGHSKGVPNEQLCYNNASRFVELLKQQGYKYEDIIPYGESMGAAVAAHIARKYNLSSLIIESGLPSIKDLIKHWHSMLSIFSVIFSEFDTVSYLNGYKGKTLVMHSIEDEIIPYPVTEQMRKLATETIDIKGFHNDPQIPWDKIKVFIG